MMEPPTTPALAILLDLDRTLVDLQSFTDYSAALADVEALVGAWSDADVPDTDWDRPTQACMAVLHSLLGDPRWREVSEAIASHERAAIPQSRPMPTVLDELDRLARLPTAVVTLLPVDVATQVLVANGIGVGPGAPVDLIVGRDPVIRPKPEPDGVLAACRRLGASPGESVMIGDSTWDAEAARRAGVGFVGVPADAFDDGTRTAPTLADALDLVLGQ
jgi:phosphoglycolate phosphatase-like HAD superfamily hydrolase